MNNAIAVFWVMLVIAVGFWFVKGRQIYLKTEGAEERTNQVLRLEGAAGGGARVDRTSTLSYVAHCHR